MTDLTDKLLKEKRKVGMYPISEDSFLDMGEFEEIPDGKEIGLEVRVITGNKGFT